MNHVTALALAKSVHQDRLAGARRRSQRPPTTAPRPASQPSPFGEMARVLLVGFRQRPEPTR